MMNYSVTSIAKIIAYFSCAVILIPAGRDIVATHKSILPGDDEIIALLTVHPAAAQWLWPMWGFNHCALVVLKLRAIFYDNNDDKFMLKFVFATAVYTTYLLIISESEMVQAGATMMGFIVICSLQCLSLGYLGFVSGDDKTKVQ